MPAEDLWQEILDRAEKIHHSGYLWTNPKGQPWTDIRGSLKAAAKKSGWKGRMYQHLLRHSTSQVTEIYTHLSTDRLSAVAKSLTGDVNKK